MDLSDLKLSHSMFVINVNFNPLYELVHSSHTGYANPSVHNKLELSIALLGLI